MANRPKLIASLEEAYPLNGKGFDEIEQKNGASCFLSPFLCGTSDPRIIAYVHLGIMLAASLISLITFGILAIANKDILFYLALAGVILSLIPLPFILAALIGMMKRRANTCIPMVVFLCFLGVASTIGFAFVMVITYGADTNMQFAAIACYAVSLLYLSHVIRVLLRVRLDTLEQRVRISYVRGQDGTCKVTKSINY